MQDPPTSFKEPSIHEHIVSNHENIATSQHHSTPFDSDHEEEQEQDQNQEPNPEHETQNNQETTKLLNTRLSKSSHKSSTTTQADLEEVDETEIENENQEKSSDTGSKKSSTSSYANITSGDMTDSVADPKIGPAKVEGEGDDQLLENDVENLQKYSQIGLEPRQNENQEQNQEQNQKPNENKTPNKKPNENLNLDVTDHVQLELQPNNDQMKNSTDTTSQKLLEPDL